VDRQRLCRLARERDLRGERALLIGARRALTVEVEPGLADRHAALVRRERSQFREVDVIEALRRVRMPADGRVNLGERLGRSQRRTGGRTVSADREHPCHADRFGGHDELGVRRLAQV
jgi:hypothetical protein